MTDILVGLAIGLVLAVAVMVWQRHVAKRERVELAGLLAEKRVAAEKQAAYATERSERFKVLCVRDGGNDVTTLYSGTGAEARKIYEASDPQVLGGEIRFYDGAECRGAKR